MGQFEGLAKFLRASPSSCTLKFSDTSMCGYNWQSDFVRRPIFLRREHCRRTGTSSRECVKGFDEE